MPDPLTMPDDHSIRALQQIYAYNRPLLLACVKDMIEVDRDGWSEVLVTVAGRIVSDPHDRAVHDGRINAMALWPVEARVCLVYLAVEVMEAALMTLRIFARELTRTGSTRAVTALTLAQLLNLRVDQSTVGLAVAIDRLEVTDIDDLVTCCTGAIIALGVSSVDLLALVPSGT